MILKFVHIMALCVAILACPLYFPGESIFGPAGPVTYYGVQPLASSPQYKPGEPKIRQQSTVDEQIYGSTVAPAGGAGMKWTWHF